MRHVVITALTRPHLESTMCWCRPDMVECDCGADCGSVLLHKDPTVRGDSQHRMAMFSEQYVRGLAPSDG